MSNSELLFLLNLLLFLVLVFGVASWIYQGKRFGRVLGESAIPAANVIVESNPGPTFVSETEVGIIEPVRPISPSWPYTDFPRSAPGSIRWKQSSFDSVPYFSGKIRKSGMEESFSPWTLSSCEKCSKKEGLTTETNVAVDSKKPDPVIESAKPTTAPQTNAPLPTSGISPENPSPKEEEKKETTTSVTTITSTSTPNTATDSKEAPMPTQPSATASKTTTTTAAAAPAPVAVQGNGTDVLKPPNQLVNDTTTATSSKPKDAKDMKTGSDLTTPLDQNTGSYVEKKPVLPANAITDTVKHRMKLLGDLATPGNTGDMAQPLYLMMLLQQQQTKMNNATSNDKKRNLENEEPKMNVATTRVESIPA